MPPEITALQNQFTNSQHETLMTAHNLDTLADIVWYEAESIRTFMPLQRQTQILSLFVIPMIFALLYDSVYLPGLYAWTFISIIFIAYRWWLSSQYMKHIYAAGDDAQLKFKNKHSWTWIMSAFVWSTLDWLFFGQASLGDQVICWVILAGIGFHGATSYSPHDKTMKQFVNTMLITLLLGMAWRFIFNTQAAIASMTYIAVPLSFLFWRIIRNAGLKMNKSHVKSLKLHKGNEKLITSLKESNARANKAVETKNRLLASAAHDIRQPILALDLYTSMLKSDPSMMPVLTEKIGSATQSVIDMFDSLFDLSRLESGQLYVNLKTISTERLLQELQFQYQPAAAAKRLELRIRTSSVLLETDHQLLKRILGNLLMNAIKFTSLGGVLLACRPTRQGGVRFEIWDTGIGIHSDEQEAVFKEFYKAPSNTGTNDGFGLGLSIVARFCEPLGYTFSMRSRIGRGSVFCIETPSLRASA